MKGNPYEFGSELSWGWDGGVVVDRDDASSLKVNARILIIIVELLFPPKRWMSQHPQARDILSGIEFTIQILIGRCHKYGSVWKGLSIILIGRCDLEEIQSWYGLRPQACMCGL